MFDGISFFKFYGIKFTKSSKNVSDGWVGLSCPFCGDKSDHLGYNVGGSYFYCWKCGGHSVFNTIKRLLKVSDSDTFKVIRDFTKEYVLKQPKKEQVKGAKHVEIPKTPLSERERNYIEKRGFDSFALEKDYGIVGGGIAGRWKFRVVIPIRQNNICVSLQGRAISPKIEPRYLFLPEEESIIPAKHCIFNLDNCSDRIVLVEGVFSVFRFGKDFGSTFGAKLTNEQLAILSQFSSVTFFFDNDEAGKRGADTYGSTLASLGINVESIMIKDDIDSLPEDEVWAIRKELGL